jgi:hypothetical protein
MVNHSSSLTDLNGSTPVQEAAYVEFFGDFSQSFQTNAEVLP